MDTSAPPQTADLLVQHALLITQDAQRRVIEDGALAIRDGRLLAVGPTAEIAPRFAARRSLDGQGRALFPGLVNTHTHLFQSAVKGLGEDMGVEAWVRAVTFPTARAMSPEEVYLTSLVCCLENLRSGATTLVDFHYPVKDPALHEPVIRAMLDSGLRGRYSRMVNDAGADSGIIPELIQPADEALAHAGELAERYQGAGGGRLEIGLSVGSIWGVSEAGLRATRQAADARRMPVTMHINESRYDNASALERFGRGTIPMLAHTGLLGPDLLAVHCVHMSDEDIALFVQHDVKISYNAVSNMYLGSGIPPMVKMARAGLTISIATDGAGSNNCQDMLETLKFSALLQKAAAEDASVVLAQTAVDWATRGGAQAMGLSAQIGSLEPGKQADFFLVDPYTPKATPVHDPVATLVYSAGQANVATVVVDGQVLLEDGVFKNLDEPALLREAQRAAQALARRSGTEHLLDHRARWRPL
ncbi:MAG: amidohydrolase [Anaerolineales bacterium]|nr:amidohydrolase [Anaerolineales bacterium]